MPSRVSNLRRKIADRTKELNVVFEARPDGHWYGFGKADWKSVTRKLGLIKDEGLLNWKMNRALEHIEQNWGYMFEKKQTMAELIAQAKLAPQLEFEGAGDIGKAVHDFRERWFNQWINTGDSGDWGAGVERENKTEVIAACEGIRRCMMALHAQPLACELRLADDKLRLGGTLDDLWAVPFDEKIAEDYHEGDPLARSYKIKRRWETWLVDLKTSRIGDKNNFYMQVATYWAMFRKLYKIKIDKVFILHTSKTKFGEYDLIPLKHPKRYFQMAKSAYNLYDDLEELRELKKPEIARITKP